MENQQRNLAKIRSASFFLNTEELNILKFYITVDYEDGGTQTLVGLH
jgi:hypothetical protein